MTPLRAEVLTKYLKRMDRRLYARYEGDGLINILFSDALVNRLVMSLTDTWSTDGKPRLWGIEPIFLRLRQIDASGSESIFEEIRKNREREDASKKRARKAMFEDGVREARPGFAKSFNDYNTSILDKSKDKRRIKGA